MNIVWLLLKTDTGQGQVIPIGDRAEEDRAGIAIFDVWIGRIRLKSESQCQCQMVRLL